jgi:phage-related baseplate assembly protein
MNGTPPLDNRDTEAIVQDWLQRLPAYVPGWQPRPGTASWAIVQIFARHLRSIAERLNEAPDKNKLAFLDRLGINLLPAQAARAPVVFEAMTNVGDSRVPVRTRLGANVPGLSEPLIFETETAIGLAAAQLTQVVTLMPSRDMYADHTKAAIARQPFTLFQPLQSVPHELYLAHTPGLALAGRSTTELQFELSQRAEQPLAIEWECWGDKGWHPFKPLKIPAAATEQDSLDGTEGLTRSGTLRLVTDCAESAPTAINGVTGFWLRGRTTQPLPPTANLVLPQVDRITVRTVIRQEVWSQTLILKDLEEGETPTLSGTIKDSQGNPLSGVSIFLTAVDGRDATNAQGRFSFTIDQSVDSPLRLEKSGLPTFVGKLEVSNAAVEMNFILNPGLQPDVAFADGLKLDLTKTFYPFGQQPQPGTAFYLKCTEALSKPGAIATFYAQVAATTQGESGDGSTNAAAPRLIAEYWNGQRWQTLGVSSSQLVSFFNNGDSFTIEVPFDLTTTTINGDAGLWIRLRIVDRTFARIRTIRWTDPDATTPNTIKIVETVPPALAEFRLGYVYQSPPDAPQVCLTYNDFQWQDYSDQARWRGSSFEPFAVMADRTPTLYLGFDRPLPADLISLYFDIQEVAGQTQGALLKWEYWDGTTWLPLSVQDETRELALPGMISAVWAGVPALPAAAVLQAKGTQVQLIDARQSAQFAAGDLLYISQSGKGELAILADTAQDTLILKTPLSETYAQAIVSRALLPRFGKPCTWMRARLQSDGEPLATQLNGIYLNAVWASQSQTFESEVLGSSNAQPNQVFFTRNTPVLTGAIVEVRELEGLRAPIELPLLLEELQQRGMSAADLRTVIDRRIGQVSQVWVRWHERPNLFFSGATDRHYVLERSQGRIIFGNGQQGWVPPAGIDNIRIQTYRSGGELVGNVPAGGISQLLAGVLAQSVSNPRAAEGGADTEAIVAVRTRAPKAMRHRYQAVTLEDYEALAREASPAVAVARALPTTHPSGRSASGWVKVVIMPQSQDSQPQPSFELRRQVQQFLAARVPAAVADRISVVGPDYLAIGVEAVVVPLNAQTAGTVGEQVQQALTRFLNPLTGGPDGDGWRFGRAVYLSDVAATLERVPGVDYIRELNLLLGGTPQGETIPVPPDRIVVAGALRILLKGSER